MQLDTLNNQTGQATIAQPAVCPGCGRCRHCGQPTPSPWYWYYSHPYNGQYFVGALPNLNNDISLG